MCRYLEIGKLLILSEYFPYSCSLFLPDSVVLLQLYMLQCASKGTDKKLVQDAKLSRDWPDILDQDRY